MKVKSALIIILMPCNYSQIKIYLGDYRVVYLFRCPINLLNQSQTLLKVLLGSFELAHLEITVSKLVANVDEQDRLVEDYF